ncbi:MAG TPA: DUF3575 domain-containing protein [Flavobacteriales bacterium]|nr:DUF3575 domain-containing protein [Flavobacteriales bacterium]HPQ59345.1 DUF3575 domain-containing protein [Flavobacteriales bacterium]
MLLGLVLAMGPVHAQEEVAALPDREHVVKLGLTSGAVRTLSLTYERVIHPDWSGAVTLSYMFPGKPAGFLDLNTEEVTFSSDRSLKGWFITPELRWYLETSDTRDAPRGFHLGGYARVSNISFDASLSATGTGTDASGSVQGSLAVDFFEFGIGIQAGYQLLMIKDRLALDCIFFGPRASFYALKVDAELAGEGELATDVQQALEELLGRDIVPIDVEVSSNGVTTSDVLSFGYRFGIKLGYAF